MKILVVEDSPTVRHSLKMSLVPANHTVDFAENGEAALVYLGVNSVDLILMDVEMSGMNGFELARLYRHLHGDDWVPIIFLSGNADDEHILEGIKAGGDAYLNKEASPIHLMAQITAMERIAKMRHQLHSSNRKIEMLLQAAPDGIISISERGIIQSINSAMERISGYRSDELMESPFTLLLPESLRGDYQQDFWRYIRGEEVKLLGMTMELEGQRKNGESYPIELSIGEVNEPDTHLFMVILRDITERKQAGEKLEQAQQELLEANVRLEQLTILDGLTGIANRRYFDISMEREFGVAKRENTTLGLIMCDIDLFKTYNDTLGHVAGDECIKQVAEAIQNSVRRPADVAARYGGEEFAIILPRTALSGALAMAKNIQEAIHEKNIPCATAEVDDRVTVSLGVCCINPEGGDTIPDFIKLADKALYQAKENGRNRIEYVSDKRKGDDDEVAASEGLTM